MPQLLNLSRAARLAGVTRAELQRRIRHGEAETFEGEIKVSDLMRLYPKVSLDDDAMVTRVEHIKATAVPRSHEADTVLPSPEVLVTRLRNLSDSLADKVACLEASERLIQELHERLRTITTGASATPETKALEAWLVEQRSELAERAQPTEKARFLAGDSFLRIMAASVKLIPSGKEFLVEGSNSILDAAVRAGIGVSYGCSSGNCGECKARVISGEVTRIRDHDYVLSENERRLGYMLTCSNTAVTDLVLEAAEAHSVEDLPQQQIRANIRRIDAVGDELRLLHVQTPRSQTLRFMAGQRAILSLENGASTELPIASCPCNGRDLWFYLRRRDNRFTDCIFDESFTSRQVTVEGPKGHFVLREDAPDPAVLVAVGDGIAPIKSLIEHAISIDHIDSFRLYWITDLPERHHQEHWCRALSDSLDNFSYRLYEGDDLDALAKQVVADGGDDGSLYYLAAPEQDLARLKARIAESGVTSERMICEALS